MKATWLKREGCHRPDRLRSHPKPRIDKTRTEAEVAPAPQRPHNGRPPAVRRDARPRQTATSTASSDAANQAAPVLPPRRSPRGGREPLVPLDRHPRRQMLLEDRGPRPWRTPSAGVIGRNDAVIGGGQRRAGRSRSQPPGPQPGHRQLLPRPHRRQQDRSPPAPSPSSSTTTTPSSALRAGTCPAEKHTVSPGSSAASRLRRLATRRPAHRGGPAPALLRRPARRGREAPIRRPSTSSSRCSTTAG